jgi:hypothetical protein
MTHISICLQCYSFLVVAVFKFDYRMHKFVRRIVKKRKIEEKELRDEFVNELWG